MKSDVILNYLSWLEERGLDTPSSYTMTHVLHEPNISTPLDAIETRTEALEPKEPLEDETAPAKTYPRAKRALNIPQSELVLVCMDTPESKALHTLTRLLRAINISDGQFFCFTWNQHSTEPGAFLDALEAAQCKSLIIFGKELSELLLDQNYQNIAYQITETPYEYLALASDSLDILTAEPALKAQLWKSLVKLFKISLH